MAAQESTQHGPAFVDRPLSLFFKKPLNPNLFTALTLVFGFLAGVFFTAGNLKFAGALVLMSGFCDLSDGYLARTFDRATKFGAFLDSVTDRYSEFFIFAGLSLYYLFKGQVFNILLVYAGLLGAFMTSYTRARAESLGMTCRVGIVKRPGRVILVSAGALFNALPIILWIITIFANVTAAQRVYSVYHDLKKKK